MVRAEAGAVVLEEDLPLPTPEQDEVRVKVAHTAICGTDRHIYHWDDSISHLVNPPVIIGHEFCGYVDALGSAVVGWEEGDYVSAEMHLVCGQCRACQRGDHHVCVNTRIAGLQAPGCFAEYVVVPARNLVRLDPKIVPTHIGAFLDALGNAVHTVQASTSIAGRHVLLSGYGAIGAMAAAVVEFEGAASLTISEVAEPHLERARRWAATRSERVPIRIVDPRRDGDTLETIRADTDGGVDVVLEMSGAPPAIELGLDALFPGGEMMLLGIPKDRDLLLRRFSEQIIFKGLTLKGVVGRRVFSTWVEMLGLLERGLELEHIVTHRMPMGSFTEGIGLLDRCEAHKVVMDPSQA